MPLSLRRANTSARTPLSIGSSVAVSPNFEWSVVVVFEECQSEKHEVVRRMDGEMADHA